MARVLIVDDSKAYRLRLRRLVSNLGHEALIARSGEEGLEIARAEQPEIILMDIVMPGMNGYEAKRSLARDETTRHIPVVFVTTRTDKVDRVWGMRQGAVAYVTKPIDPVDLQAAISNAIAA